MTTIFWIFLLILAIAGGAWWYLKRPTDETKPKARPGPFDPPVRKPNPDLYGKEVTPTPYKPKEAPGTPVSGPPPSGAPGITPAPVLDKVPAAPKQEKPAPEGWFRHANGQIYRNTDPKALWNPAVARTTKRIDFALMDGGLLPEQDLGNVRLNRLAYSAFPLPDVSFAVDIGPSTLLNTSVVYLCDKTGKVIDFTISAIGSNLSEGMLTHNKGSIEGGPYIVQASDGISADSQFSRPNPARRKRTKT